MNKNLFFQLLSAVGLIFTVNSCTKEIYFSLPEEPLKLVLMAQAVGDEQIIAFVSYSTASYSPDTVISNFAPNLILEKDGQPLESLIPVGSGTNKYWRSTVKLEANAYYSIIVSADGFETIKGTTFVPEFTRLKTLETNPAAYTYIVLDSANQVLRAPIRIQPDNLGNNDSLFAFRIKYVRYESTGQEIESSASFLADGSIFVNLHESPDGVFLINQKLWRNNPDALLPVQVLMPHNTLKTDSMFIDLEWRTVSKEYYFYYLSIARQGDLTLPFSTPDVLYNNIENGLGNFSGFVRNNYRVRIK